MTRYYRPLGQSGAHRPAGALSLAGGNVWFTHAEVLGRGITPEIVAVDQIPDEALARLSAPRADVCGLPMTTPQIMGILNVTPDSFSDGGKFNAAEDAQTRAEQMQADGAAILDIGGESTRPGADYIDPMEEINRTAPVIETLRQTKTCAPISIDTRKMAVAHAALNAGAAIVNDVSGLTFDEHMADLVANRGVPVCVMHSQGLPETMQNDPQYGDVLLDVYDFLAGQIDRLVDMGVTRDQIIVDPGIGFGKTQAHNLALLQGLSLFHGLGCAILLGVSRKRFIGDIGQEPQADARAAGSIAVGLAGLAQGVQILRVHDVRETAQAVRLWQAVR